MNLFQIILCLFSGLFGFHFIKKANALFDYSIIILSLLIFNFFLFNPNNLKSISNFFGIHRGVDIFLYLSTLLLFLLVFRLLLKIEKNKKDISMLNRKIALLHTKERSN